MQVKNKASRIHVAIEAIKCASKFNNSVQSKQDELINFLENKLKEHESFIAENGIDKEFVW